MRDGKGTYSEANVAVLVPTRGRNSAWLANSVASIRNNGVDPLVIVGEEVKLDPRLDLQLLRTKHSGLSRVLNEGLRATMDRYEFVTWLGDDDALAPGSIRAARNALHRHPDASFAYGWCRVVLEDGRTLKVARPTRFAWRWLPFGTDLVPQPGSLLRSEAVKAAGLLDDQLRYAMDLDLFLRLSRYGAPAYVARELATWRVHSGSLSSNKGDGDREAWRVRRRYWSSAVKTSYPIWRPPSVALDAALRATQRYVVGRVGISSPRPYWT